MSSAHVLVLIAYLLGSLSSAVIVCRLAGLPDPRGAGSGNPGATNVLRVGGKKLAAITLLGDLLKGVVPVLLGHLLGIEPVLLGAVGLAAFMGHLYPIFFGFHGGKGVATAIGVLLAIDWLAGLATVVTWLVVARLSRYSSLASLVATGLAPAYVGWRTGSVGLAVACAVMTLLLYLRHTDNIRRLLAGTESRIGGGSGKDESPAA